MSIPQEILSTTGVIRTPLLFRLLQIKQMNLHYQHATQVVKIDMQICLVLWNYYLLMQMK